MIIIKNKTVKIGLLLTFIIVASNLFYSCQTTKAISMLLSEDVKPQRIEYKDKEIIFAPLIHFGKVVYYDNLTDSIKSWKEEGNIIFYEGVRNTPEYMNIDSIQADTLMRQLRKMMGGELPSREVYATMKEVKMFENNITQPGNKALGLDSNDVSADVSIRDLVYKYEEFYGPITLDTCDFNTPLDSTANCGEKLKNKIDPVIVDYRNEVVVNMIKSSDSKKIVVLYGAAHLKGMKKLLKEKSSNKK